MATPPSLPNRWLWLIAYVVLMAVVAGALVSARNWALRELAGPEAQADWQTWKQHAIEQQQDRSAPVQRKVPSRDEPPLLVVLRDYFVGTMVSVLLIASFLFAFAAIVARGAFGGRARGAAKRADADA